MCSQKSMALILFAALLAPALVQARTYQTFTVNVPFEFTVGERKFKPGAYTFVILGPGLIALEDGKKHVLTTLIARDIRVSDGNPSSHVFFDMRKGRNHLASLWMGNGRPGLEIVGEQVAMRQNQPLPPPFLMPPEQLLRVAPSLLK